MKPTITIHIQSVISIMTFYIASQFPNAGFSESAQTQTDCNTHTNTLFIQSSHNSGCDGHFLRMITETCRFSLKDQEMIFRICKSSLQSVVLRAKHILKLSIVSSRQTVVECSRGERIVCVCVCLNWRNLSTFAISTFSLKVDFGDDEKCFTPTDCSPALFSTFRRC